MSSTIEGMHRHSRIANANVDQSSSAWAGARERLLNQQQTRSRNCNLVLLMFFVSAVVLIRFTACLRDNNSSWSSCLFTSATALCKIKRTCLGVNTPSRISSSRHTALDEPVSKSSMVSVTAWLRLEAADSMPYSTAALRTIRRAWLRDNPVSCIKDSQHDADVEPARRSAAVLSR